MSAQSIKVGIVGAGNNTRVRHIPGLQAIEGVEIVSVCNRSRESSQRTADAFHIPKVYDDWRKLIAADDTNAIVIGTWPYMHCEVTCAALEAGKHVMCEARMAKNATEAHIMLEKSQAHANLITQIVPSPFTLRVDRTIQDLIADGYVGDLYAMTVRGITPGFTNPEAPLHWRQRQDLSGFNILTMGIWYEAVMRWVGPASRVFARTRVYTPQRRDPETGTMGTVDVPDHVDIVADLACGAQATYEFSAVCGLAPASGAWLFGSKGTLHYDQASDKLFGGRQGEKALQEITVAPEKAGRWRVEEEFVGAIRGQEEIRFTAFADGVKYMEFTEAVHRSAASGQIVSLPLAEFRS
ncbi:MAG TPA: Gfo/Idh/MocA family oxidoreductase [Candidatus Binatia bacterium]|nr:Gfo/Idh/MocA family oxidoreductase [Candidatus Binatia bacterium]